MSRRAKRRLTVLVSLIVLVSAGMITLKELRARQQRRLVEEARIQGVGAYERGDLGTALRELSYYLQHNRSNPEAIEIIMMFADARSRVPRPDGGHRKEAMDLFQHGRRLLNDHPELPDRDALLQETRSRLLELYFERGFHTELLGTAGVMLQRDPDDVVALGTRARAQFAAREYEPALEDVKRLTVLEPEDPAWKHLRLQIMRGLKRPMEEQIALCDEWIAGYEGDGRMHLLKAGWLAEIGRLDEARVAAEAAAQRGADTLDVLQRLVSLLDLMEMRQTASEVLDSARIRFPDEQWVPEATVRRLWQSGRTSEALAEIDRAAEEFKILETGLLKLRAVLLMTAGRPEEARAALEVLRNSAGDDEAGRAVLAWATALAARLDLDRLTWHEVTDAYQEAMLLEPSDALLSFLIGEAYASVGERFVAIDAFQHAFALQPNWLAAGAALTEALLDAGRPHEAFKVSRRVLDRATEKPATLYLLLARAYVASLRAGGDPVITDAADGRTIAITALLTALHDQFPGLPGVSALLAEAFCLRGRPEEARLFAEMRLADDEADSDELLSLARVSMEYGLGLEGDLVARARAIHGPSIPVALAQAELYGEQQRFDEGLAVIDEAIAAAPPVQRDARSTRQARVAYLFRMEHPDAIPELSALMNDLPRSIEVQSFALAQPEAWSDSAVVQTAIANLADVLGEHAPQVHLAQANYLLRFHAQEEAELARAIMLISEVLERVPNSLPGLILMAQASLVGEHPSVERAISHLESAVNLAPGRGELYLQLIALLQDQGNYDAAGRYLLQLTRLAERDRSLLHSELRLLRVQGDFETALLRAGQLIDERSPVSDQLLLAALHQRAGDREAAKAVYDRLLAADRPGDFVIAQAAEFYASIGDLSQGAALLERMEPEGGPAARALMLGAFHRRHGQPVEAMRWLEQAIEQDRDSAEVHHQLARLCLEIPDLRRAQEEALAGLAIEPQHTGLRATLATANMSLDPGDRGQAIALLRELGAEEDALLATLTLLEEVPVIDGVSSPTDANLAEARALIESYPQFLPAWYLALALHREAGRVREAIELARRAVSRFPASAEPSQWSTRLLMSYRRWDEALVEAQEWRRRAPDDTASVDLILAQILLQLNRPADAVRQLSPHADLFLAQRDLRDGPLALWIRVLVVAGSGDRAWEIVRPLLEEDPKWLALWLALTEIAGYDEAYGMLAAAEPVIDGLGPEAVIRFARAWNALGWRFTDGDCFDRAEALIRTLPDDPAFRFSSLSVIGRIAEGRGDMASAERAYREMLRQEPDNAAVLNNLAFVLSQSPERCGEALAFAEQALTQQPDQPDLLDTYGHVLRCLGRTEEAREALERALASRPDDIAIRLNLVETHLAASALDEAAAALIRARRAFDALTVPQPALQRKLEAAEQHLRQARASAGSS